MVDIGTRDRVALSKFGFEGATKKNKPDLKVSSRIQNSNSASALVEVWKMHSLIAHL
jgi:hypothetical protein